MLLLHVYILLIPLLHNIVYNVLSDNKNCCYKIVMELLAGSYHRIDHYNHNQTLLNRGLTGYYEILPMVCMHLTFSYSTRNV